MILSDREIQEAVAAGDIVIDPFRPEALNPNSYDVHLGQTILVYEDHELDAREENRAVEMRPLDYDRRHCCWRLVPGRVYLAVTEEYTETLRHVPYLDGKSSVGRLGIAIHATAGRGDVGFKNHWTMELVVAQPVKVYAGMPIGQLTYHETTSLPLVEYGAAARGSKYQGRDPRPQPSRMFKNFPKVDR